MLVLSVGFGPVFVGTTTAANAGVPPDKAGLAAAQRLPAGRRGLGAGGPHRRALTGGFDLPLLLGSIFILAAAFVALRATNTRGEASP